MMQVHWLQGFPPMRWSLLLMAGLCLGTPSLAIAAPDAFSTCLGTLKAQAGKQGITGERFDALTAGLTPDPTVLPLLDAQPEFTTPLWDYLAALVDTQRVADGRAR